MSYVTAWDSRRWRRWRELLTRRRRKVYVCRSNRARSIFVTPLGHWSDIMTDQSNRYVQHHLCCVFINYVVALANRVVSTDFLSGLTSPNKHVISEKKNLQTPRQDLWTTRMHTLWELFPSFQHTLLNVCYSYHAYFGAFSAVHTKLIFCSKSPLFTNSIAFVKLNGGTECKMLGDLRHVRLYIESTYGR